MVPFPNQSWQGSVEATSCGPGQLSLELLTVKMAKVSAGGGRSKVFLGGIGEKGSLIVKLSSQD